MKTNIVKIGLICALAFATAPQFSNASHPDSLVVIQAKNKTEKFKVYGNCGMCEKTIEGALKDVTGIEKADWNQKTKMMVVTFDENVITLLEIKQKIADVGYDTDEVKASETSYKKLPGCCQYERPDSTGN